MELFFYCKKGRVNYMPYGVPQATWDLMPEVIRNDVQSSYNATHHTTAENGPSDTPISSRADTVDTEQANQTVPAATAVKEDPMAAYQSYYDNLSNARKQNRIAELGKARQSALIDLDTEQAGLSSKYYGKRNEAAANNDIGSMNFAQYMAGKNIKGSAGAMPEIYRNANLQNQIGSLNRDEAAANADIAGQRAKINSGYSSDVASAEADIDADTMQSMVEAFKSQKAQAAADNAAMGLTSTGEQTLEGKRSEDERKAALEAAYKANVGQFSDNYQAEINNVTR
jgi:hypothetical protein